MSAALKNQIGPYHFADGAKIEKTFEFDRTFTILIASAYNARGLIGAEKNGIVVLDDDNRSVVLDEHFIEDSGYYGPTARQWAELKRISRMDWSEFAQFCRTHPRYRGLSPDINAGAGPDSGDPLSRAIAKNVIPGRPGRSILPDAMSGADLPYAFDLKTREDITVFLANHAGRSEGNRFFLSWNIKVYSADWTGTNNGRETVDSSFDERWEEYVNDPDFFATMCEDGLRDYMDGDWTAWPGSAGEKFSFACAGRSGGHLVLTQWSGPDAPSLTWASRDDFIAALKEMSDAELASLYRVVRVLDKDLSDPSAEISFQVAEARKCHEEAWREEERMTP